MVRQAEQERRRGRRRGLFAMLHSLASGVYWEEAHLVEDDLERVIGLSVVDAAVAEGSPRALALLSGLAVLGGRRVGPRARTERVRSANGATKPGLARCARPSPVAGVVEDTGTLWGWRHGGLGLEARWIPAPCHRGAHRPQPRLKRQGRARCRRRRMLRVLWEHEVPGVTAVDNDPQEAADVLAHGLEIERRYLDSPATEELRRFRPLLRTYLRALPSPRALQRSSLHEPDRDRLAEEFAASDEARGLDPAVIDDLAWRIVDVATTRMATLCGGARSWWSCS
jgi:hypothetical protein